MPEYIFPSFQITLVFFFIFDSWLYVTLAKIFETMSIVSWKSLRNSDVVIDRSCKLQLKLTFAPRML